MASEAPNLHKLDSETRSKIRSTQILTSLPQIVSELVQNSLDAGAKNVEIGIDMDEWACWVRDDGTGMSKQGLNLIAQGCEHGRYATSKAYNPSSLDHVTTFGFRGEALASASDVSCLEIASRTIRSKESWSLILRGGATLYQGPSTRWRRERAGTTVAIRDAFYNLPIRRLSHPTVSRTTELIRREIEALALVFPNVAFSLEDSSRDRKGGIEKSRILSIPKTNTTLKAFRHIYGRTLVEHVEELHERRDSLSIEGFLSLVGSHSKAYQFLFVNRHILETCDLHRIIEQKFGASSFSKNALDEVGEVSLPRTSARRSPRKNERKPVFVVNITVPPCQIDNCLEPAKSAVHFQDQRPVISSLADVIDRFLVRHGFKNEKVDVGEMEGHVTKRRRIESEFEDNDIRPARETAESDSPSKKRQDPEIYIQNLDPDARDEETTWVDPRSGQVYIVDQRTGNSYLKDQQCGDCTRVPARRRILGKARDHHRLNPDSDDTHEMPDWIRKALEGNTAFAPTEREINDLQPKRPINEDHTQSNHFRHRQKQRIQPSSVLQESLFGVNTMPLSTLSQTSLSNAHVIEQVDRKFIACLVELPTCPKNESAGTERQDIATTKTLVLVDQHAADERVRVERYLKDICLGFLDREGAGVCRRMLDSPASVLLSNAECEELSSSLRMKKAFHNWGFDLCENQGSSDAENGYTTVYFDAVPEVVADKLLSGEDLSEFVKGFLARLASDGLDDSGAVQDKHFADMGTEPSADGSDLAWLKALRFCPRELVELINSKACRGAIMFNDPLTVEQCKRLMRQLSTTAFPFQCAHGRPSVVPLMTIDPAGANVGMTRTVDWSRLNDDL